MILSVTYQAKSAKEADEIKCPANQLSLILKNLSRSQAPRTSVQYESEKTTYDKLCEQIKLLEPINPNYTIETYKLADCSRLLEAGYKAFLHYPVTDWETFTELQNLGVSDIWIDGPLCFQLDKITKAKAKRPVMIRVSPTKSSNSIFSYSITSSYIRPEDLSLYSQAIDVLDFQEVDIDREDALFKIYKRGSFSFTLDKLFGNSFPKTANPLVTSQLAEKRINCGQRCKVPGQTCHFCEAYFSALDSTINLLQKK